MTIPVLQKMTLLGDCMQFAIARSEGRLCTMTHGWETAICCSAVVPWLT